MNFINNKIYHFQKDIGLWNENIENQTSVQAKRDREK